MDRLSLRFHVIHSGAGFYSCEGAKFQQSAHFSNTYHNLMLREESFDLKPVIM